MESVRKSSSRLSSDIEALAQQFVESPIGSAKQARLLHEVCRSPCPECSRHGNIFASAEGGAGFMYRLRVACLSCGMRSSCMVRR